MIPKHIPVMATETLTWLDVKPGGTYIDATVGEGGHSTLIAARIGRSGRLAIIDQDTGILELAQRRLETIGPRIIPQNSGFDRIGELAGLAPIDGILFDFGVSSHQLDNPARGLSYWADAPLDMRLNPGAELTAARIVNEYPESELSRIIQAYGEERWASRIAAFIADARKRRPIETTAELEQTIKNAIPAGARRTGGHPARKTFQALRIAVNDELGQITRALPEAIELLGPGGRLVTIAYHSLEDRIAKRTFTRLAQCQCPPELPQCRCGGPTVRILVRRPISPRPEEIDENPRARSARLRCIAKLSPVLAGVEGE